MVYDEKERNQDVDNHNILLEIVIYFLLFFGMMALFYFMWQQPLNIHNGV